MKKIIPLFLVTLLCINLLVACTEEPTPMDTSVVPVENITEEFFEDVTEEPTEEATEEVAEEIMEEPIEEATEKVTEATNEPTTQPNSETGTFEESNETELL